MAVVHSSKMNFAEVIQDMLKKQYYPNVVEVTTKVIDEVSKEAVKKLRQESPKRNGKYAPGWTRKVETKRMEVGAIVYGKSGTYQLAHLLEHGHAKRGGGHTKPIVHIKPVEEWAINEAYERILDRLEGNA